MVYRLSWDELNGITVNNGIWRIELTSCCLVAGGDEFDDWVTGENAPGFPNSDVEPTVLVASPGGGLIWVSNGRPQAIFEKERKRIPIYFQMGCSLKNIHRSTTFAIAIIKKQIIIFILWVDARDTANVELLTDIFLLF